MTATFKTTPAFAAGIRGLIQKCRLNARTVVLKETGELIKTLVKMSPPNNPGKTRESIKNSAARKFEGAAAGGGHVGQSGSSGITWYGVDKDFLRGVAPQRDMRAANESQLYALFKTLTNKGHQKLAFKHPRKHQRVLIAQKVLAKKSTIAKIIKRIQTHVGRLKAGWLVAATAGPIRMGGANMPPGWVTRHAQGARGRFVDGTGNKDYPKFLIGNSSVGIGNRRNNIGWIVNGAVKIRAAAMAKNTLLFCRGKKFIRDYA